MARERAHNSGKKAANGRASRAAAGKSADTLALEKRMSDALGLGVSIDERGRGGVLSIRYRNFEQLDEVVRRLEKRR
jgi:ParB family chromosome partitioning protein